MNIITAMPRQHLCMRWQDSARQHLEVWICRYMLQGGVLSARRCQAAASLPGYSGHASAQVYTYQFSESFTAVHSTILHVLSELLSEAASASRRALPSATPPSALPRASQAPTVCACISFQPCYHKIVRLAGKRNASSASTAACAAAVSIVPGSKPGRWAWRSAALVESDRHAMRTQGC